jgi:hypothetical protein
MSLRERRRVTIGNLGFVSQYSSTIMMMIGSPSVRKTSWYFVTSKDASICVPVQISTNRFVLEPLATSRRIAWRDLEGDVAKDLISDESWEVA